MVSLLMLTIIYIQAVTVYLYIHTWGRFNSHTVCNFTGSWSYQPVLSGLWRWYILCLKWDSNPYFLHSGPVCEPIAQVKLPGVITLPMPPYLSASLPESPVQTTTLFLLVRWITHSCVGNLLVAPPTEVINATWCRVHAQHGRSRTHTRSTLEEQSCSARPSVTLASCLL